MKFRFLCRGHFTVKQQDAKPGTWMKNYYNDVSPGKKMHCDKPGCHYKLSSDSSKEQFMWVFYKTDGNGYGDRVSKKSQTYPSWHAPKPGTSLKAKKI